MYRLFWVLFHVWTGSIKANTSELNIFIFIARKIFHFLLIRRRRANKTDVIPQSSSQRQKDLHNNRNSGFTAESWRLFQVWSPKGPKSLKHPQVVTGSHIFLPLYQQMHECSFDFSDSKAEFGGKCFSFGFRWQSFSLTPEQLNDDGAEACGNKAAVIEIELLGPACI